MKYIVKMKIYLPDAIYSATKKVYANSELDACDKASKEASKDMCISRTLIHIKDINLVWA